MPDQADGKDGYIHLETENYGFNQTIFKVWNELFKAVIIIENNNRGKKLNDVTKKENITEDIVNSYGNNPKFNFLRDISTTPMYHKRQQVSRNNIPSVPEI